MATGLICSCSGPKSSKSYDSESSNYETSESSNTGYESENSDYREPESSNSSIEHREITYRVVSISAEVFHLIYNYDGSGTLKDANRTKTISVRIYDSGSACLVGSSPSEGGIVRYSKLPGYEYECNEGNEWYAFNYDF